MAEYIEKEAAVKELDRKYGLLSGYHPQFYTGYQFAKKMMEQEPAADVAPVVHGWWDSSGRYEFTDGSIAVRCTKCGCSLHEKEYMENVWNYCPVCGAKMDLEGLL